MYHRYLSIHPHYVAIAIILLLTVLLVLHIDTQAVTVSKSSNVLIDKTNSLPDILLSESAANLQTYNVQLIGQIGGVSHAIYVVGNLAYVGEGYRLSILDISNPVNPVKLGKTQPLPQIIQGVFVLGSFAYVVVGNSGLRLVDITDPTKPSEISFYDTPGNAFDIFVANGFAYVADGERGLRVINVADPTTPYEVGFYDTPGDAYDIQLTGSFAFIADGESGLRIVNIANPTTPIEVAYYNTSGEADGVYVLENLVYLADGIGGLRIINIANPAVPIEVGFYDTPGRAQDVVVISQIAFVSDEYHGIRAVNVMNPIMPKEIGFYDTPGYSVEAYVVGNMLYLADGTSGLRVMNVTDPTLPIEVSFYDTLGLIKGIYTLGNIVYVAAGSNGLRLVDITSPTSAHEVGFFDTPGDSYGVHVLGNIAYVADGSKGLRLVDVTNPAIPSEVGFFDTPGSARGVQVLGYSAYVADHDTGLRVLGVQDPSKPSESGFYDNFSCADGVYVVRFTAYIAECFYLQLVNVTNPFTPSPLGSYRPLDSVMGVYVVGSLAYVANGNNGLRIVNIANHTTPTEVGFYDTSGHSRAVHVIGDIAYVADWTGGLRVINVASPAAPFEVGFFDTHGMASNVFAIDNIIYSADSMGGLSILRYPPCYRLIIRTVGNFATPNVVPNNTLGCSLREYVSGTSVTISANPSPNWRVIGWVGTKNDSSTSLNNIVEMPAADHEVTVIYAPICYSLSLSFIGNGASPTATPTNSANCPSGQYITDETITVTSKAGTGSTVGGWTGTLSDTATTTTNQIIMPGGNHSVNVRYVPACYALRLERVNQGPTPITTPKMSNGCALGQYHANESITLSATPANGWLVIGWSGLNNPGVTSTLASLTMPANDHTVTVHYGQPQTSSPGDSYESDNGCALSQEVEINGATPQLHTFHAPGDEDWVRFYAEANVGYLLNITTARDSVADVIVESLQSCDGIPPEAWKWNKAFSPGARILLTPKSHGPIFVRIAHVDPNVAGANATYQLSVESIPSGDSSRAAIIVAGRWRANDSLQVNIENSAQLVYKMFLNNGYTSDNIYYLSTNRNTPGYDQDTTQTNLKNAITQWAASKVEANGVLNLYLVDHGNVERLYLDDVNNQVLTTADLDGWLTSFENVVPGVKVNVIVEACLSGSFIDSAGGSISKANRVIFTSTSATEDAYASIDGAYFSDHFFSFVRQRFTLASAYQVTNYILDGLGKPKSWIDANGNGVPNEATDVAIARQRGFGIKGSFDDSSNFDWQPFIFSASTSSSSDNESYLLQADIRDDRQVKLAWVVVYPPNYQLPPSGQQLQRELLPTFLLEPGNESNQWRAAITGLKLPGVYRLVLHAVDNADLKAEPIQIEVEIKEGKNEHHIFLPLIWR